MLKPAVTIGPFPLGIDNRSAAYDVPRGAVRDAVNVDITSRGRLRRRKGTTRTLLRTAARSLWAPRGGARGFFADGDTLYEYADSGPQALTAGLVPGAPVCYVESPGRGFAFSDGYTLRRIVGNQVLPFATPTPRSLPVVTRATGGSMGPGLYQFGCSWLHADGEESGVNQTVQAECQAGDVVSITFPPGAPADVTAVALYMTPLNSETLGLVSTFPIGTTGTTVSVEPTLGREPISRFTVPLPAGDMLAVLNGRTYTHRAGRVLFTEPWSGQHSPVAGYIPFPELVTILYATPTGMWIVADQTYFLSGDPSNQGTLRARAPKRAVPGTLVESPNGKTAIWFSEDGIVTTGEEGALSFVQQNHVEVFPATAGASLFREQDGQRQVVSSTKGAGASVAQASTWFNATISSGAIRDGFA